MAVEGFAPCRVCGKQLPLPPWKIIEGSMECLEHSTPGITPCRHHAQAKFDPDALTRVLARLFRDYSLRELSGEDTIGVLMRCGAFHEAPDSDALPGTEEASFVVRLADAIEAAEREIGS